MASDDLQGSTMAALMSVAKKPQNDRGEDIKISSEISRHQDTKQDDVYESIRKVVKEIGHETSPLRVTPSENELLEDTVHHLKKKQKLRTDKNQVVRLSLNYILNDYEQNGKDSLLVTMLERLKA